MQNGHLNDQQECLECDLPTQEYLNYFDGLFMTARDFQIEQSHRMGKHRQHNRYLHGWGTVCGLRIVQHPDPACRDRFVVLEPGLALDCCGREIMVREKVYIDLVKYLAPQEDNAPPAGDILLFSLCYAECKTEFVPALYAECGCDEVGCEASRIHEGFEIEVQRVNQLPKSLATDPVGVRLQWKTTFNLAQAAYLIIDSVRKRLYVLTAADPGQIMVYDTDNGVLLTTIAKVETRGVGLAINPTGQFLYIIRHVAGSPGNYFLRVVDVQNLNNPTTVNDLPLTDGILDNPPQLRVSPTDGKVFTLDVNASPKKLIIWKTDINSPFPNATAIDAAKYVEVTISTDPRSIAVSPDGIWLFIGDDGTNNIQVSRIDTLTQPDISQVTQTVSLGETPKLLAVSGDSLRLYVVTAPATGDRKVRAFRIEVSTPGSPPTLTEIGSGVAIGAADPIAMVVSPSGKWAYILSKDSTTDKGEIWVINGEKLATDPTHAVLPPTAVLANPQDLLLSADGRQIYASGSGSEDKPASGVSVLEVDEAPCRELLWQALEGCPTCPEDTCVPLAAIQPYTKGKFINDEDIDNRIRPLVPSTDTLQKLILCALETGGGKQGSEGPQGPAGPRGPAGPQGLQGLKGNGDKGDPGEGLERDLTQINALSWRHNEGDNPLVPITANGVPTGLEGIVVSFNKPVRVLKLAQNDTSNAAIALAAEIAARHIFQVSIEKRQKEEEEEEEQFLRCRCPIEGFVVPVETTVDPNNLFRIVSANYTIQQQPGTEPGTENDVYLMANGMAFVPTPRSVGRATTANELWISLQGDFIVDENGRAIDAEFVRAELPTGDRPSGSPAGIQGGLFESWFWIEKPPKPSELTIKFIGLVPEG